MLIALPPSESKTPPHSHTLLNPDALSRPELRSYRKEVAQALAIVSRRKDAPTILGLGPKVACEASWNCALLTAPAAPASSVYTGVLYQALGLSELAQQVSPRVLESVAIFSGLWGVLSPTDVIPPYRLAMKTNLPGIGRLAGWWRPRLESALSDVSGPVIDCRSTDYAAAWNPPGHSMIKIRAMKEHSVGRRIISHMAKRFRGILARELLLSGQQPGDSQELAELVNDQLRNAIAVKDDVHIRAEAEPQGVLLIVT